MESWGTLPGYANGRSLNFTLQPDRIAAVEWWIRQAYAAFEAEAFQHVYLSGFYWFLEEIAIGTVRVFRQKSTLEECHY
jgi:hypothetical protein